MTEEEEYRQKEVIRTLLDQQVVAEAFSTMREDIVNEILATSPDDASARERLYVEAGLVDRVYGRLNAFANEMRVMTPTGEEPNA